MTSGIVMVEERSARHVVTALAGHLGLSDRIRLVSFEGKSDLERSFCRKIAAWRHPADVRFLISRDNDGADCHALKARLAAVVPAPFADRVKIRLVIQELEAWYLGDFDALVAAGLLTEARRQQVAGRARFRQPDELTNAAQLFRDLCGFTGKIGAAEAVGPHLIPDRNRSVSFRHFVYALRWAARA